MSSPSSQASTSQSSHAVVPLKGGSKGASTLQPKVVLSTDQEQLSSNGVAKITFTFNTPPLGFTLDDIKVTNGVLSGLVADPLNANVFTAQFFGGLADHSGMSTIKVEGPYLDAAGASGSPSNTVTIKNLHTSVMPTVGFVSNNMSIVEGDNGKKLATFELVLSNAVKGDVTVGFSTDTKNYGTAKAGSDFVAKTGSVVFAAGETRKTISVEIIGDTLHESNENFYVDITSAKGAVVVLSGAEGGRSSWVSATIKNDDASVIPTVGFARNNLSIVEGNEGRKLMQVAVNLSAASTEQVSVDYSTQKKAYGTATAGFDYIASTGTLVFAPGETTKLVSVEIIGDKLVETNENFYIDLVAAKGAAVVIDGTEGSRNSWVSATIQNDDSNARPTVGFAKNNQSIVEGNAGVKVMQFTVNLSAAAKEAVSVAYSTEAKTYGSAKAYQDYVPTSGNLVFAAGEVSKTISVEVVGDTLYEGSENFYLDLIGATGADIVVNGAEGLRNSWVSGTISNDDLASAPGQIGGIVGTTGKDNIGGTAHAELIDGRGGADLLTGYSGSDTFVFAAAYASRSVQDAARILDFKDNTDLVGLRGGLGFADLMVTKSSEGALVSLANGDALVVLVGVNTASLNASDFVSI